MATIAKIANKTLFKYGDGATTEAFTTIPGVTRISGPDMRLDLLDASNHDTTDNFREYIPGMQDGDNVTADFHWVTNNATHKQIRVDQYAALKKNTKLVYPDSTDNTVTMAGYVTSLKGTANIGEIKMMSMTYKITGQPVWS